MKRLKVAIASVLAACLAFALVGCEQEEYTPELKSPAVGTPTIGQAGVLRVGVNTTKSPLAGMGNSKIIGIDVDIASALADELGLGVEIVDVGSDPTSAFDEGKCDIVMGIDVSDSDPGFWLSTPYLETGVALFAMEGSGAGVPAAEDDVKIAAQVSSKSAWAVTNEFGEAKLVSEADLTTALNDVASGTADYLASDAVIGMYAANRQGTDVEIVALMDTASGYCVGVPTDNTELQNTVQTALSAITSDGTVGVIEQKWLGGELTLTSTPKTAGIKVTGEDVAAAAEEKISGSSSAASSASSSSSSASSSARNAA